MINMGLKMLFSISFFQWVLLVQSVEPFVYDVNFAGAVGDGESDDTEVYFLLKCYGWEVYDILIVYLYNYFRPSRMHGMLSVVRISL